MNRRNFFKIVIGFVAGVYAVFVPKTKAIEPSYSGSSSTGIDPNSEWAKQRPLSLADLEKIREEIMLDEWRRQVWNYPAYVIHEDGTTEPVSYQDFYIPISEDKHYKIV